MNYKYIQSIEEMISSYQSDDKELDICIDFKYYKKEDIEIIISDFNKLKEVGFICSLSIYAENRNFNDEEIAIFMYYEDRLQKEGYKLLINGGYKNGYTLQELILADSKLDEIIDGINKAKLSPLEKFLYIYDYLTDKTYVDADKDELNNNAYLSRDIISVMNTNYIVCSGYSALMKHLCDNVGIKCIVQYLNCDEKHANNLVFIDDDKYDVHGLYYADATWDAIKQDDLYSKRLSFCLIPLSDTLKHSSEIIHPFPAYLPFYGKYESLVCDPMDAETTLIGRNVSVSLPFEYYYVPGIAETELGLKDEVEKSYQEAIDQFIDFKDEAADILYNIFKKLSVKENIYDFYAKSGTSLYFLFAILCTLDNKEDLIEKRIQSLLDSKKDNPFEQQDYQVFIRIDDIYLMLEEIKKLDGKSINLSDYDFQKKIVTLMNTTSEFGPDDYIQVKTRKDVYSVIYEIIYRIRLLLLYPKVLNAVKNLYPQGNPIDVEKYENALKTVYKSHGLSEIDINNKVNDIINSTYFASNVAFDKNAKNSFVLEDVKPLFERILSESDLVNKYENQGDYFKIYTNILLGQSNDYLNLYLIHEDDSWRLTDSNNIYMILDGIYDIKENDYNSISKKHGLFNENYCLSRITNLYNLENDLKRFQQFVESIITNRYN